MTSQQKFVVRAAGSDCAALQHFIGKFPGETPDLASDDWRAEAEDVPTNASNRPPASSMRWVGQNVLGHGVVRSLDDCLGSIE